MTFANERKHLKKVILRVLDSYDLFFYLAKGPGRHLPYRCKARAQTPILLKDAARSLAK